MIATNSDFVLWIVYRYLGAWLLGLKYKTNGSVCIQVTSLYLLMNIEVNCQAREDVLIRGHIWFD